MTSEQIPISGNRDEIITKKNELNITKLAINNFSSKTENVIEDIINDNFSGLSAADKSILKELALTTRANSIAIKYMWTMIK
jgi:hypothetical protein